MSIERGVNPGGIPPLKGAPVVPEKNASVEQWESYIDGARGFLSDFSQKYSLPDNPDLNQAFLALVGSLAQVEKNCQAFKEGANTITPEIIADSVATQKDLWEQLATALEAVDPDQLAPKPTRVPDRSTGSVDSSRRVSETKRPKSEVGPTAPPPPKADAASGDETPRPSAPERAERVYEVSPEQRERVKQVFNGDPSGLYGDGKFARSRQTIADNIRLIFQALTDGKVDKFHKGINDAISKYNETRRTHKYDDAQAECVAAEMTLLKLVQEQVQKFYNDERNKALKALEPDLAMQFVQMPEVGAGAEEDAPETEPDTAAGVAETERNSASDAASVPSPPPETIAKDEAAARAAAVRAETERQFDQVRQGGVTIHASGGSSVQAGNIVGGANDGNITIGDTSVSSGNAEGASATVTTRMSEVPATSELTQARELAHTAPELAPEPAAPESTAPAAETAAPESTAPAAESTPESKEAFKKLTERVNDLNTAFKELEDLNPEVVRALGSFTAAQAAQTAVNEFIAATIEQPVSTDLEKLRLMLMRFEDGLGAVVREYEARKTAKGGDEMEYKQGSLYTEPEAFAAKLRELGMIEKKAFEKKVDTPLNRTQLIEKYNAAESKDEKINAAVELVSAQSRRLLEIFESFEGDELGNKQKEWALQQIKDTEKRYIDAIFDHPDVTAEQIDKVVATFNDQVDLIQKLIDQQNQAHEKSNGELKQFSQELVTAFGLEVRQGKELASAIENGTLFGAELINEANSFVQNLEQSTRLKLENSSLLESAKKAEIEKLRQARTTFINEIGGEAKDADGKVVEITPQYIKERIGEFVRQADEIQQSIHSEAAEKQNAYQEALSAFKEAQTAYFENRDRLNTELNSLIDKRKSRLDELQSVSDSQSTDAIKSEIVDIEKEYETKNAELKGLQAEYLLRLRESKDAKKATLSEGDDRLKEYDTVQAKIAARAFLRSGEKGYDASKRGDETDEAYEARMNALTFKDQEIEREKRMLTEKQRNLAERMLKPLGAAAEYVGDTKLGRWYQKQSKGMRLAIGAIVAAGVGAGAVAAAGGLGLLAIGGGATAGLARFGVGLVGGAVAGRAAGGTVSYAGNKFFTGRKTFESKKLEATQFAPSDLEKFKNEILAIDAARQNVARRERTVQKTAMGASVGVGAAGGIFAGYEAGQYAVGNGSETFTAGWLDALKERGGSIYDSIMGDSELPNYEALDGRPEPTPDPYGVGEHGEFDTSSSRATGEMIAPGIGDRGGDFPGDPAGDINTPATEERIAEQTRREEARSFEDSLTDSSVTAEEGPGTMSELTPEERAAAYQEARVRAADAETPEAAWGAGQSYPEPTTPSPAPEAPGAPAAEVAPSAEGAPATIVDGGEVTIEPPPGAEAAASEATPAPVPEAMPTPDIKEKVPAGRDSYFWNIAQGESSVTQPPVYAEVPLENKEPLIDLTRDYFVENPDIAKQIGYDVQSPDQFLIQPNDEVNITLWDQVARDIAVEQGWIDAPAEAEVPPVEAVTPEAPAAPEFDPNWKDGAVSVGMVTEGEYAANAYGLLYEKFSDVGIGQADVTPANQQAILAEAAQLTAADWVDVSPDSIQSMFGSEATTGFERAVETIVAREQLTSAVFDNTSFMSSSEKITSVLDTNATDLRTYYTAEGAGAKSIEITTLFPNLNPDEQYRVGAVLDALKETNLNLRSGESVEDLLTRAYAVEAIKFDGESVSARVSGSTGPFTSRIILNPPTS